MPYIISYRKVIDQHTTHILREPELPDDDSRCTELCTLDGLTYVSIPDDAVLPSQPQEIADSVSVAVIDSVLRERIKAASPHCKLISARMIETIRAKYPIDEEMYLARIGVGLANGMYLPGPSEMDEMAQFGDFVEGVRQWGRDERARLGL